MEGSGGDPPPPPPHTHAHTHMHTFTHTYTHTHTNTVFAYFVQIVPPSLHNSTLFGKPCLLGNHFLRKIFHRPPQCNYFWLETILAFFGGYFGRILTTGSRNLLFENTDFLSKEVLPEVSHLQQVFLFK